MESVRAEGVLGETSPSPPALGKNPGRENDCSDWAVNLRDTAAFSAANDSLQKADQSWSTCHVSPCPPTLYSTSLQGCCWWEEAVVEGSVVEICCVCVCVVCVCACACVCDSGGLKTLMLIDHSQKHGRLEMWGQTHIHRNARETDRSLKVWQRPISCQSIKACRLLIFSLFFFSWEGAHTLGARTTAPELYIPPMTEKFSHGALSFLTEGEQKKRKSWLVPKKKKKNH